jgi:hypothetical protein
MFQNRERNLYSKTVLVGAISSTFAVSSYASNCDEQRRQCNEGCFNTWWGEYQQCSNDRNARLADCGSFMYWLTHSHEEIAECRSGAYAEAEMCEQNAERASDDCHDGCQSEWRDCS